jgi:hypothetical protein
LVLAAMGAAALADLSGLSKGEVERIWLPFVLVASLAVTRLPRPTGRAVPWLAAQAATTIALQSALTWPW